MPNLATSTSKKPIRLIAPALVGVWTLDAYTEMQEGFPDVQPFGPRPEGLLIYTPDGFVSAQLMKPGRPLLSSGEWNAGAPEEYREIGRDYIGYCGHYQVDEDHTMVIHLPTVALVPNLIAQKQPRHVELSGDRLILTASHTRSDGASISSRLEWSRIP
jgi:hypothetical protein